MSAAAMKPLCLLKKQSAKWIASRRISVTGCRIEPAERSLKVTPCLDRGKTAGNSRQRSRRWALRTREFGGEDAGTKSNWASLTEFGLQPLRELDAIDCHPFVCADVDDLGAVFRADCERNTPPVDLRNFGLACDAPARRSRGQVANVDTRAERT